MWPFKKKKKDIEYKQGVKTIICVPVCWEDPIELLAGSGGHLMIVGDFLMDVMGGRSYTVEVCSYDEMMRTSFKVAGKVTKVSDDFLSKIEKHKSVVYITAETGSIERCRLLAKTVTKLLSGGGIGVKIETAGKAFDGNEWNTLSDNAEDSDIYKLFVLDSLLGEDGSVYSCGMHNIGLKDTIVSGLDFFNGYEVVTIFNYYQVIDKPLIVNGQTFSTAVDAPRYRIIDEKNQIYRGDKLFENPFGMWRLSKE
jgi:hypothetical protein